MKLHMGRYNALCLWLVFLEIPQQLREWKERMTKEIFYIDPNDNEVQRMRERRQEVAAVTERTNELGVAMATPQKETELKDSR